MNGCLSAFLRSVTALLLSSMCWAQFKPASPAPQRPPVLDPVPSKNQSESPTFHIKVNLVRLLVTVRDQAGGLVSTLNRADFTIEDESVPQRIAVFEQNTSFPLSVALLMDTSGSVQTDIHYEAGAVVKFVGSLLDSGNSQDTFALFTFNWRTNLESDYSRNKKRVERVMHTLHGDGGTSLYDAIYLASDSLSDREGRHVMVVITDGGDTTSYKKYQEALAAAQKADVILYPIVVIPVQGDAGRNTGGEHALATLAESTGGRIFYPQGFSRVNAAFDDIIRELRTQYMIGFYPEGVREEKRSFHPVKIMTREQSYKVSARSGYYEP